MFGFISRRIASAPDRRKPALALWLKKIKRASQNLAVFWGLEVGGKL